MLLRLTLPAADWVRLAAALEAADSLILAGVVRAVLASSPAPMVDALPLHFTPAQTGELQRIAAGLGFSLLATPVAEAPDAAGWVSAAAERAEAVAAAVAIVGAHQRRRVS